MMDIMHTVKLFIAAGIMGAVAYGVYTGLYGIIHSNTLSTLAAICASGIVYCMAAIMLRAVKGEDVASIPKIGGKMAALIDRCSIVKNRYNGTFEMMCRFSIKKRSLLCEIMCVSCVSF